MPIKIDRLTQPHVGCNQTAYAKQTVVNCNSQLVDVSIYTQEAVSYKEHRKSEQITLQC